MDSPTRDKDALDDVLLDPPLFVFPAEDSSTSSSSRSSSQQSESPRNDWALTGSMWPQDMKTPALDDLGSLSLELAYPPTDEWSAMDMDTDMSAFMSDQSHLSIDPSALQFAGQDYESMFQFTLAQPDAAPVPTQPFQLPTPKAGSNSSRSTSPAPSKSEHDSSAGINPSDLSLFTELGQKARDAAGVMLAVPAEQAQAPISPISPVADPQLLPSKVPIPRLRPSTMPSAPLPAKSLASSTASATHPTPPSSLPASSPPAVPPSAGKSVRPKTSHTTIERRYRTNLNARILALRRAVPALRILEKNTASQTQGKGLTGATAPKWDFDDVINSRGYVDGVKAAKKNSKGVVLGKAVEYIRALKRREARLQRESDGLRALLAGLVGGPELLREWEREWRARFGGEEADEVDEDEDDLDVDVDGEDGAGEDDSDEDDGRAKKRARTVKPPAPPAEKRKRGRPRKNPVPVPVPTIPAVPAPAVPAPVAPTTTPASKPLLALALIFSFFRPSVPPASHAGAVLTPTAAVVPEPAASGWSTLHALHLLVSMLLLVSLVGAYLPRRFTRWLPNALIFAPPPPPTTRTPLSKKSTPQTGDESVLRAALGAEGGVYGVVRAVLARVLRLPPRGDLRSWRRVGELDVVRGTAAPLTSKIQTYLTLAAHTPGAPADSITLALLARPFAPTSAAAHWADARRSENRTAAEKLVLDMEMDDAADALAAAASTISSSASSTASSTSDSEDDEMSSTPVRLIATRAVVARTKSLAANLFIAAVTGNHHDASDEISAVRAAGCELGGESAVLACLLERVTRYVPGEVLPVIESDEADCDSEAGAVRLLLRTTLLFRRAFPTVLPTPPPSPGQKNAALHLALRRALASPAFDMSVEMEEVRDRVVDMLAEARPAGRWALS